MQVGVGQTTGQLVRAERVRRGWTQPQLARIAGVGRATVQRIEYDTVALRAETARRLVHALDLPAEALIGGVDGRVGSNPASVNR